MRQVPLGIEKSLSGNLDKFPGDLRYVPWEVKTDLRRLESCFQELTHVSGIFKQVMPKL
jgi:hypothetical protein